MLNKSINIYNKSFDYKLTKANRKTISLSVLPCKTIIVKAPFEVSDERIESFFKRKYFWLKKQLLDIDKYKQDKTKKETISGESFLYLGRSYQLKIHEYQLIEKVILQKNILNLYTHKSLKNQQYNHKILNSWYKEQTAKIFHEEFIKMLKLFGYEEQPKITIKKMNKRWGSYTGKGTIILNPELIKASKHCISYVIAHELCHVKYRKHNQDFYNLLSIKFPNWEKTKEKLELRFT